jgi:hypothetical protein
MRLQNFTYGSDVPNYTSMAKKDFPQHNNNEAAQNLQKSKLNGLELRKSHFMLGTDPATFNRVKSSNSVNQIYTQQLASARPATISTLAKKTNVQITHNSQAGSSDFFQIETVTGTQMAAIKSEKNNPKERKATFE